MNKYSFKAIIDGKEFFPKGFYYQGEYIILVGCEKSGHTTRRKDRINSVEIQIIDYMNKEKNLKLDEAIEILEFHKEWRMGKREEMTFKPKSLVDSVDVLLEEVKKLREQNSIKKYSIEDIEKCIEHWGMCKVESDYIERFLEKDEKKTNGEG